MKTLQKSLRKRLTRDEFVEKFYNKSKSSGSKSVLIAVLRAFDNFSSQVYGETSEKLLEKLREVPQWVKNNACWWAAGLITDEDFAAGIEYLVKEGIIRV